MYGHPGAVASNPQLTAFIAVNGQSGTHAGSLGSTPHWSRAPMKKLGPGSYFTMAGGTKHVTTVEGDAPCVFYVEREGPFDVVMAEDAAAKKK